MHAVALKGVAKRFGAHQAVHPLDLEIPKGSIQGFIGPNGSGKTTTIRMILGIIEPDTGSLSVLGEHHPRGANDRVGYLPEERGLYRKMSVRRVAAYFGALKGLSAAQSRAGADSWLERLGLADWADQKVEALSKGMQQKVQFICTVIAAPELVILDEPFSGLDPVNMEVLREAVLALRAEGTTVIFSTHDMAKAEEMCDRVMMIFKGEKVLDGSLEEIRGTQGGEILRIACEGGAPQLRGLPGVHDLRDLGRFQELRCEGDHQELLKRLLERTRVTEFAVKHASLHDIFLRVAGPGARDEETAA